MALLGGGISRVMAAVDNGRGGAVSTPSELPTGDREHSWAFSGPPDQDSGGMELAQALGPPEGYWTHRGALEIVGQLPRAGRGFSPHTGSNAMLAAPPTYDPSVTFSSLSVTNADNGTGNMMGEQGYALHVKAGVSRFDGPIWGGDWVYVDGVGNLQDRFAGELGAGVDNQYYYVQGRLCGDSKGRDVTDTPITIYFPEESGLPSPGDVVFQGVRDRQGLAWGDSQPDLRDSYGKITTEWSWVTSYENSVGRIYFNPCNTPYAGSLDTTTLYSAVALAGPGTDPNGQKDVVFGFSWDKAGNRIAKTANVFDDKIGTIKDWGGTLGSIPKGWALVTSTSLGAGRFLAGYKAGTDYDPPGQTGGSHPITPTAHSDLSGINNHILTIYSATTQIIVSAHPATDTDSKQPTITVDDHPPTTSASTSPAVTVNDHAAKNTDSKQPVVSVDNHAAKNTDTKQPAVTVDNHAAKTTDTRTPTVYVDNHGTKTTGTTATGITVDSHPDHHHHGLDDGRFVNRVAGATDPADDTIVKGTTDPATCPCDTVSHDHTLDVGFFSKVSFDPDSFDSSGVVGDVLDHTVNETAHLHSISAYSHNAWQDSHYHGISLYTHVATQTPHFHGISLYTHVASQAAHLHEVSLYTHVASQAAHAHTSALLGHTATQSPHLHTVPLLGHSVTDSGHLHTAPNLTHTGTLAHGSQDFRPPFATQIRIIRTAPLYS